ncbi:hypothetical protein FNT36_20500 [Hymenobacter setariae]|uniref:Uncharacterized protein n=1 Tax=Hymenobacter setariae TaxID=2594794 RepID=A0A558BQ16_9BACT|nr:hypothetical protein [Hymenobacter setariae]TVT38565.1 hypothetical protein FNT36_20500 [Hymenobacter setariae]
MRLFILILVLSFLTQLFLPWWTIAPLCFGLAAGLGGSGGRAFGAGFMGIGLGWLLTAGWLNLRSAGLLSHRVAQLLPLGGNSWVLVLVTAVLGGLVGGVAALAGCWARQAVSPKLRAVS